MSTQNPDPYGIELNEGDEPLGVEVHRPQAHVDDRARSTRMDGKAVEPGRQCARCGYDLTGLMIEANCPECGELILSVSPHADTDALKRVPTWYLRGLGWAFALLAITGALVIVAQALVVTKFTIGASLPPVVELLIQAVVLGWFAGVVAMSWPPPEKEPRRGMGRSRLELALAGGATGTQLFTVIAILHPFVLGRVEPTLLFWAGNIGFYGLFLVALQCSKVAWRLNDEDRANRLQTAGLSIPLGSGMIVLFGTIIGAHVPFLSLFGVPFLILQLIGLVLWVWGCIYLLWSFVNLSRESFWAIRNLAAAEARAERMRQRARDEYQRAEAERAASRPFGGPLP